MGYAGSGAHPIHSSAALKRVGVVGGFAFWIADYRRASVGQGFFEGFAQGLAVAWCPNGGVGYAAEHGKVKDPVVGGAVFADHSGAVEAEDYGQLLQGDVVDPLVKGAL